MIASIKHITLNTGHTRDSLASEVAPHVVEDMANRIFDLVEWLHAPLPEPLAGFYLGGPRLRSKCLCCWLWRSSDDLSILEIGVATEQACANKLWAELCHDGPEWEPKERDDTPEVPWVAVRVHPELESVEPKLIHMLGDFERSLAWGFLAWLDRPDDHKHLPVLGRR